MFDGDCSDSASCPFLRFTFSCLQPPALFFIHLRGSAGKKLHALPMIAAAYCLLFKEEVVNELSITESCGCSLIVEECPAPRPPWSFCNCMDVSFPLTSWFSVVNGLLSSVLLFLSYCCFSLQVLSLFFPRDVVCYSFRNRICCLNWEISDWFTAATAPFIDVVTNVLI